MHFIVGLSACAIAAAGGLALAEPPQKTASYTQAQAQAGQADYAAYCTDCHGAALNDGEFGGASLKGETFQEKWFGQPAGALVGYIRAAMPPEAPGRLPVESYVDITAYLLSQNGVPASDRPLPANMDELAELPIPAPGGGPTEGH